MKLRCTGKLTGETVSFDWNSDEFKQNLLFLSGILKRTTERVELQLLRDEVIETHCYIYRSVR